MRRVSGYLFYAVFILLLVGVTFNFGRMNARNNNKAQAAIRDMMGL